MEELLADQWLESIDRAGRELIDTVTGIDALDAMAAKHTRPSLGWMQRNTRKRSTTTIS